MRFALRMARGDGTVGGRGSQLYYLDDFNFIFLKLIIYFTIRQPPYTIQPSTTQINNSIRAASSSFNTAPLPSAAAVDCGAYVHGVR